MFSLQQTAKFDIETSAKYEYLFVLARAPGEFLFSPFPQPLQRSKYYSSVSARQLGEKTGAVGPVPGIA